MSDEILKLFEGLTDREIYELRKAILPALRELREAIVTKSQNKQDERKAQKAQRIKNETLKR